MQEIALFYALFANIFREHAPGWWTPYHAPLCQVRLPQVTPPPLRRQPTGLRCEGQQETRITMVVGVYRVALELPCAAYGNG